jgi:hypothetical protein
VKFALFAYAITLLLLVDLNFNVAETVTGLL